MPSQKRVRDELQFVIELTTLFDVLQQTAVSQLRRADERVAQQPHLQEWLTHDVFPLLPVAAEQDALVRGGSRGQLLVLLTSNEGLAGPLHGAVVREALRRAEDKAEWWLVGQRGRRLLNAQITPAQVIPAPSDDQADIQMRRVARALLARYTQATVREAWLVTSRFVSATHQEAVAYPLLPLPLGRGVGRLTDPELIIEPSVQQVVREVASLWVEAVCVEAFWSARRAECSARTLHMELSCQALTKQLRLIRYELYKAMHERVDVAVRESCLVAMKAGAR